MRKIAIDICLLLPENIEDLCIDINEKSEKIRPLGKDDYIPHITLAMGIIEEDDIIAIQNFLENLKIKPFEVTIDKIKYTETPGGNKSSFVITKNEELQYLHETILGGIKKYLQKGANVDMLYKGDETGIGENTKIWLDTYSERTAFRNFWPHISLGCYNAKADLPIKFKVDTFVLCHAGDGVTCRKILFKYKLH